MTWGSEVEIERRNRIRLSIMAYAYEVEDNPVASDKEFDELALKIRPQMDTGHFDLDDFFRDEFSAHTGQWVLKHPEMEKLKQATVRFRSNVCQKS